MSRNMKMLGLALAAFFAVSAVTAQAAFAEEEFHAHAKHIVVTSEAHPQFPNQTIIFNNNAGEKKGETVCKQLKLEGDVEGTETVGTGTWTSKEVTVRPNFSECEITSPFKEAATVASGKEGKCHFRFTAKTEETTPGEKHARLRVTCPKGENITTSTAKGCVITFNNEENPVGSGEFGQTPTHGVVYTNVNTKGETNTKEITAHLTLKGIKYTTNFTCQLGGLPASGEKAEYNGTSTLFAKKYVSGSTGNYLDETQVGIWKE